MIYCITKLAWVCDASHFSVDNGWKKLTETLKIMVLTAFLVALFLIRINRSRVYNVPKLCIEIVNLILSLHFYLLIYFA